MKRIVATLQPSPEEVWANVSAFPRTDRYPIDPRFLWQTQEGEVLRVQDMQTSHIWNSFKMVWNHRVSPEYRIIPFKKYKGIDKMSSARVKWIVQNLVNELGNRDDLTPFMKKTLAQIVQWLMSNVAVMVVDKA